MRCILYICIYISTYGIVRLIVFLICVEKKSAPEKKITGPKPELPRTAQRASQAAIQPASQPRSQRLWPPGRPADQPASQGPEQPGSGTGPKMDTKCVRCGGSPRFRNEQDLKKIKWGPKQSCPSQVVEDRSPRISCQGPGLPSPTWPYPWPRPILL